jgi:hypothetical protein
MVGWAQGDNIEITRPLAHTNTSCDVVDFGWHLADKAAH